MTRSTEYVNIRVKWNGGMRWGKFPFWMSDQAVIRETMDALGVLAPNDPSAFTVEREEEVQERTQHDRSLLTQVYLRVCKDAAYQLDCVRAAQIAAGVAKVTPFEILEAVGSLDNLREVAAGKHPARRKLQEDQRETDQAATALADAPCGI